MSVVKYALDVTATKQRTAQFESIVRAVPRSQAVAEFDLKANLLDANEVFCELMGYRLAEIVGKPYGFFAAGTRGAGGPADEDADTELWAGLRAGTHAGCEFRRIGKGGKEIWVHATFNPILDEDGRPFRVVEFATDITSAKLRNAEYQSQVAAINRSQAVVEFGLDGTLLTANQNFLDVMGYSLDEVRGQHHSMFVDEAFAGSGDYRAFWDKLRRGEFVAGVFSRRGRDGREVWLRATYNPVLGLDNKPCKVVKFASDITESRLEQTDVASRLAALDRSMAVIVFDLEGNILDANENFLRTTGYSLREIVGSHHSMFCTPEHLKSAEYRNFWVRLRGGEHISGEFQRVGKYAAPLWLQASYNPVLDMAGEPVKIVKYAHDVTDQVDLKHRVTSKAGEMTTSVARLTTSIDQIAGNATAAADLAGGTQAYAEEGFSALRESIEAIGLIQRSSAAITDIVTVIGEIAGQTNLLAFNASIEAAWAGEHGVGFNVVASEVRKLAERSSEAADQISRLINESQERVGHGSQVSERAQESFQRIVESVAKTGEAIRQIAASTTDQQEASHAFRELIASLDPGQGR